MKLRALIFDIDGTLLNAGGAGRGAIEQALVEVAGIRGGLGSIRLHGNTDRLIFSALLERFPELQNEGIAAVVSRYVQLLPTLLQACPKKALLPGVQPLLRELVRKNVRLGIATGNLREGARAKLEAFGLNSYFTFGGYGDDGIQRGAILARAVERSGFPREVLGFVGDTPYDGEAGVQCGVPTVGVTTGIYSAQTLLESGCTLVLSCLSQLSGALLHTLV